MKTTRTKSKASIQVIYGRLAGLLTLVLAFTLAACQDTQVDQLETIDETDAVEGDFGRTGTADSRIVAVSITGEGEVLPTVPAGPTTFQVNNDASEECALTLVPQESQGTALDSDSPLGSEATEPGAGGAMTQTPDEQTLPPDDAAGDPYAQDDAASDQDVTTPGAADQDVTTPGAADQDVTTPGAADQDVTTPGAADQTVEAGQAENIMMDLQPGLYEVACADDVQAQGQTDASPMYVMVTESTTGATELNADSLDGAIQDEGLGSDTTTGLY